ncbi:MAG: efflux RND transporter periplasmic adaptor subunit, partial [Syntrophales bacterium]|nr:efflux RND transporter periplasmic adaptor subunit [Syntrophales bacterium]
MRRKIIIIVICLHIAGVALSYYFVPAGTWKKIAEKVGIVKTAKVAAADRAHQHGGGVAVTETKADMESAGKTGEEAPTVEIPEDKQQLIGVRTVKASVRAMNRLIRTVGRIEYDERKLATANTKIEGWIEKLYVDYTGRYVKKGEPLAEIYSPELIATQQEFINTLRWVNQGREVKDERTAMFLTKDAQAILEASKERLRLWDISDEQIAKIETTGKPVRTLTIYSPVSGFVVQKMA